MAPKGGRGGGGSSGGSSSSSSCDQCNEPLQLDSTDYSSPNARAILALEVILLIVVVVCMIVVARRPWLKLNQTKDKYKYRVYQLMGLSQFLYLILDIVDSILNQLNTTTTKGYLIMYILRNFFFRFSEICMLVIILRCLEGARNAMKTSYTKLRTLNFAVIGLLSILTLTAWALYTKYVADSLSYSGSGSSYYVTANIDTADSAITFAVALGMVALVLFLAIKKAIPASSMTLLAVIVGAYWLSALLNLIFDAIVYNSFLAYTVGLGTATGVISVLATIAIFIALAMLSHSSNQKTRQLATGEQHQSLDGPTEPLAWNHVPKNDNQNFSTDTSYQGGGYVNNQWNAPQNNNISNTQYGQQNHYDPAAQPLYPSQTYNPPQQMSHVYDSGAPQYPPMQQAPMQQGPIQSQPQRYYGNSHAYSAVPQASG